MQSVIHTREMFQLLLDKLTPLGYEQYFASYSYKNTFERSCSLSKNMDCFEKNYTLSEMCKYQHYTANALRFS